MQGELERATGRIFQEPLPKVIGAGRTDSGVHATGQVVNFTVPDWFPMDKVGVALNTVLPIDIRIRRAHEVAESFHARYSAKSRKYIYVVLNRVDPSALLARYVWHMRDPLDLDIMRSSADELVGTHDFASFGLPDKPGKSTVRQILDIRMQRRKDSIFIAIRANAFLRGMARSIAGTLVETGRGRRRPEEIKEILAAKDCGAVHVIAPPRGLYLTRVEY